MTSRTLMAVGVSCIAVVLVIVGLALVGELAAMAAARDYASGAHHKLWVAIGSNCAREEQGR